MVVRLFYLAVSGTIRFLYTGQGKYALKGVFPMELEINFCTTTEGVHLAYSVLGQGPFMLMPPAWVSHLEMEWAIPEIRAFWEKLASTNTLVRYDKHGCGLSDRDRTDFSLQKEVRDLEAIVDHLKLESFALFGFSQGGPISIVYAAAHPEHVSRLILYGAFSRGDATAIPEVKASIIQIIRKSWGFGSSILSDVFIPSGNVDQQSFFTQFQKKAASGEIAAQVLEAENNWDVTGWLPEITQPTLILHRKGDRAVSLAAGRELATHIPHAKFVVLEGRDHLPYLGDWESVLKAINDFLGSRTMPRTEQSPTEKTYRRSLRAVFSADVEGYSCLMNDDADATICTLSDYRQILRIWIENHQGRVVDAIGDNLLADFASVRDAVQCAVDVQKELAAKNAELPEKRRMHFRIGINLGDIVEQDGRIYGDGVNIAARMEGLAQGGGICISGTVYDQIENKLCLNCAYLGKKKVKNFPRAVRAYRIEID